jgi:hypothetical protein
MNIPSHTPDSGRHLPAKAYAEFVSPWVNSVTCSPNWQNVETQPLT